MQFMQNLTFKIKEKKYKMDKKTKIKFNILAVFAILIFCFAITPKTLQNDTYYTIKIGEHIVENGIDMKDPFSWHEDLPYTYPHWAYDVAIYQVFHLGEMTGIGGFTAIYISTVVLAMVLGVLIYFICNKICKNQLVAFFITFGMLYLLKGFIAARAQLVTYSLFILQILFIEQFLSTKKKRYAVGLVIIPIIIANVHLAVWPFYFVLFLPYIGEYILVTIIDSDWYCKFAIKWNKHRVKKLSRKSNKEEKISKITAKINTLQEILEKSQIRRSERRENPYRLILKKESAAKWLILIMIICAFTGLLTPVGDAPYTYLTKTMQGNTMQNINEHLPLTLIDSKDILVVFMLFLAMLIFTDTKIQLRDFFMLAGLTLLCFISRRQISMFVLICGFIFAKLIAALLDKYDKDGSDKMIEGMTKFLGKTLTILIVILMSFYFYRGKIKAPIINQASYPVAACDYMLHNLDIDNMRLYNEYNYGSYILYRGIPVFIDSRADLYAPEFNGTKGEDGKYKGRDIFTDYINISNISTYYEDKFEQYGITHIIVKVNTKLNIFLKRDDKYKQLYSDKNFVIYERTQTE